MKWQMDLFGEFQLVGPSGALLKSKSVKLKVLLAYLALQPGGRASRRTLANQLFSADELPGSPNLSLLLTRSQTALAQIDKLPLLASHGDHLHLIEDNYVADVQEFEAKAAKARLESDPFRAAVAWLEAIEVVKGEPLRDLDHPLLTDHVENLRHKVLEGLLELARGPLAGSSTSTILALLKSFDFESSRSSLSVERLMRIYGELGLKDELVRVFTEFESYMDFEYGEAPHHSIIQLFNSILAQLDGPTAASPTRNAPERPDHTIGREGVIEFILQRLQSAGPRVVTVTGQSGIGKSHLLRELYWRWPSSQKEYVDLESMPADVAHRYLTGRSPEVILLDHSQSMEIEVVHRLLRDLPDAKVVRAGHTRLGAADEHVVILGPLEVGTESDPGPAAEMLRASLALVTSSADDPTERDSRILFQLARLCEGIPLALEIAGRLGGTIGLQATLRTFERNLEGVGATRDESGRGNSLQSAIASSFSCLSEHSRTPVRLLARLNARCHADHLITASQCLPVDLEEAILSGLIVREPGRSYVRVPQSTALYVEANSPCEAESFEAFCRRTIDWFLERARDLPLDLDIADSLPLAASIAKKMVGSGDREGAMRLLASFRPWLGSSPLPVSILEPLDEVVAGDEAQDATVWASAVLALSAAYFHSGAFDRMAATVESARRATAFPNLSVDFRCQLTMQAGLAKRALGEVERAIERYHEAVALADRTVPDSTLVKCYYNLGTLLESQERLAEALQAQESAAEHFSEDTDPRVETLVNTCLGRLRYRVENDLVAASLILEATLAHATQRGDRRATAEVLQNLGLIYWERQMFLRAAAAEAVGTRLLLEFGYTPDFRILAKSSFVTLSLALFGAGEDVLAKAVRSIIDRLGSHELYKPNQAMFTDLESKTYATPAGLKFSAVGEAAVRELLDEVIARLEAACLERGENTEMFALRPHPHSPSGQADTGRTKAG